MYSYEDRIRAVMLYIKFGKRIGATLRQLGYLTKLLANKPVARYLKQKQPELLTEFEAIVQAASLDH